MTEPGTTGPGTSAAHARGSRELVLGRIRAALYGPAAPTARAGDGRATAPAGPPVPRDYLRSHVPADDPAALLDLLHRNLADYRALVHRCTPAHLPETVAGLLDARGARTVAVPADLPPGWLAAVRSTEPVPDDGTLTAARLDTVDSVLTGCALAVAETGTLVLDAGPGQGRRLLSLVPDHHVCVVLAPEQVVASVPLALPRLDPRRPQTWISGPSATSDIELDRVEGVHGPRTLEVVLVTEG
ncbi:LUD domain-containing protein [Kitasatospora sp. CM 4170]|uniref:Lactate utilization protein C n=1 Tax=Kitasatospora aburaviensis TaxID=67265 RepID=A0ABW1F1J7_9ACTN|nr:LUD domain-containing protein [Kitasatospora sp. CM 4170]WNM49325.1 LUD domain-containing protein [Kitasatospora sp. CM 4170]